MMFHSLRARLLASYVVIIFLTLAIVGVGLLFLLQDFQRGITNQRLIDALGPASAQARLGFKNNADPAALAADIQDNNPAWRVLMMDEQGIIIADPRNELLRQRLPRIANLQNLGRLPFTTGRQIVGGRELIFVASPVRQNDNARVFLVLATLVRPFWDSIQEIIRPLSLAGISALLVAIVIALLLARSISQPLGQLTRATQEIARNKYDTQIPEMGQDEVGQLAASFNVMARAVQHSHRVQKDFVANVSHELKTPLTSIQGFSQAIFEGATHDLAGAQHAAHLIHEEAQRMGRLVTDLLTLARLDTGQVPMDQDTLDLTTILPVWLERFQKRAQTENFTLTTEIHATPLVTGDAGRLEQVVTNLLDNAFKYNKPGGGIRVTLNTGQPKPVAANKRAPATQYAVLSVHDTGQGIPLAAQPRLFERFYRVDPARAAGGSGLGLSIVQEIVHAHRGEITVESQPEMGTTFQVWLPAKTGA